MSSFCPDGYVPVQDAVIIAAQYWFADRWAEIEKLAGGVAELARALSRPPIPDALRDPCADIVTQTVHRLRNHLYQGLLKAYYFGGLVGPSEGRQTLPREFWTTSDADDVLEEGIYLPLGRPSKWYEPPRPSFPLFFLEAELDALLSGQKPAHQQTSAAQTDPPGRKPGQQSIKDRACEAVLSILNHDAKRPPRRHGRKAELARMVRADLQKDGQRYKDNSVEKMIRDTVAHWEAKNPDK
jgi:hypothetical protein